jgi:hypothetical protein
MIDFLYTFSIYLHFLPILVGVYLLFFKKLNRMYIPVLLFLCISAFSDIISIWIAQKYHNNLFVFSIYALLDTSLIFYFIQQFLQQKKAKLVFMSLLAFFFIFSFWSALTFGFERFNSIQLALGALFIILLILYFFFEIFYFETIEDLTRFPAFWIASVWLVYYAGTLFLNLLFNDVINGYLSFKVDLTNIILLIITNIVCTLSLWMARKKPIMK